jgi:hypothetical protein
LLITTAEIALLVVHVPLNYNGAARSGPPEEMGGPKKTSEGGSVHLPPSRGHGSRPYGTETLVLSPELVMVKVPDAVEV